MSSLLDIVAVTDKLSDIRFAVFTERADLGRVYSVGGRTGKFCEIVRKRCRDGFYDMREVRTVAPIVSR